jgi:hypothetical protein
MTMTGAGIIRLDVPRYGGDLDAAASYLDRLEYAAVKTKYNAKRQWQAVSLRGFSDDPLDILKPNVLGSRQRGEVGLRDTALMEVPELQPLKEIASCLPTDCERVRVMRLEAGTQISKHTDKIDKAIGLDDGQVARIHIPIRTHPHVVFSVWQDKVKRNYFLQRGAFYFTNVVLPHSVKNNWTQDRLHLVVDCYVNDDLRALIRRSAGDAVVS